MGSDYDGKDSGDLGKDYGKLGKEFGKLGGRPKNGFNKEHSLASSQACETCTRWSRLLPSKSFWLEDWRHRTDSHMKIMCMECCPTPRKKRFSGYMVCRTGAARLWLVRRDGLPATTGPDQYIVG